MKEMLAKLGFRRTPPLERAMNKARQELTNLELKPRKKSDYWYLYETLSARIQRNGLTKSLLQERGALPRRGLQFRDVERTVGENSSVLSANTRVEIDPLATKLQEVVRFTKKGRRLLPGTLKNDPAV